MAPDSRPGRPRRRAVGLADGHRHLHVADHRDRGNPARREVWAVDVGQLELHEIVSSHFLLSKLAPPKMNDPVSVKREWGKRHKRFHDSLVATCTSPWSLHFRSELFDQARRYHWLTMIHARSRRRNEHLDLRDAVLARDVDLACGLIEKHIRTTVEQAASKQGMTVAQFRSLEDKIERDDTLRERVRTALRKAANPAAKETDQEQ